MGYDRIGNEYLLMKKLGEGGYATVYKAKNLEYGYIRAIRVLNTHVESEQEKVYQNFLRECRVLLRLGNGCHPNIVRLYQPRHVAGRAFVEMDWVDGEDLRQLIERHGGKVPVEETMRMVREIGSALAYCHHDIYKFCYDRESDQLEDADDGTARITPEVEQRLVEKYRVIHNDIHTGNIMRRRDGEYVLLDFGLAVDGKSDVVNSSRRQQGAIEFLSAQRLDGMDPTPQDDIYGFGCVVYAMLTGKPPFPVIKKVKGKDIPVTEQSRICMAHKETPPPPIERNDVPEWLNEMTMRCLAKQPQDRYADGYELYREVLKHTEARKEEAEELPDVATKDENAIVESLNQEIEQLEKKNAEFLEQYESERETSEHLEKMLGEKAKEAAAMAEEAKQLKGENERLKAELDKKGKPKRIWYLIWILVGAGLMLFALNKTNRLVSPTQIEQIDSIGNGNNELAEENVVLQHRVDSLLNETKVLAQSRTASSDEYAALKRENNNLESQNSTLESSNRNLKNDISAKEKQLSDLKNKNRNLAKQLQTALNNNSNSDQQQRTITQLRRRVSELEKENKALIDNM